MYLPLCAALLLASTTRSSGPMMSVPSTSKGAAVKPRILCLHGAYQSAYTFYNKIAGARRKLSRAYELDFLDGPVEIEQEQPEGVVEGASEGGGAVLRAWWRRDGNGRHVHVKESFEYVRETIDGRQYDAIIGFSQGGTLATALALSGTIPGLKAVVTAGAPLVDEAFMVATDIATNNYDSDNPMADGLGIPKLHIAGERDDLVAFDRSMALCEKGGSGKMVVHEQGHLFPTRAAIVNQVIEFLGEALQEEEEESMKR